MSYIFIYCLIYFCFFLSTFFFFFSLGVCKYFVHKPLSPLSSIPAQGIPRLVTNISTLSPFRGVSYWRQNGNASHATTTTIQEQLFVSCPSPPALAWHSDRFGYWRGNAQSTVRPPSSISCQFVSGSRSVHTLAWKRRNPIAWKSTSLNKVRSMPGSSNFPLEIFEYVVHSGQLLRYQPRTRVQFDSTGERRRSIARSRLAPSWLPIGHLCL